jgi:hypothetical protein
MLMTTQQLTRSDSRKPALMPGSRCNPKRRHHRQKTTWGTGLTKADAEDVLDWLEAHGHRHCRVRYVTGEGFAVTE